MVAQTDALKVESALIAGLAIKDWKDVAANTSIYSMQWNPPMTCNTDKWETATACNGVAKSWGYNTLTNYNGATVPVTKGSIRAWMFLADVGADLTRVMSIEKGQTLQVLLYEFRDKKPGTCNTGVAWTTAAGTGGCTGGTNKVYEYAWWVTSVSVSGAVSRAVELAALTTVVAGLLF